MADATVPAGGAASAKTRFTIPKNTIRFSTACQTSWPTRAFWWRAPTI